MPSWGLGTVCVDGASGFWIRTVPHWKQHCYVGHPLANCTVQLLFLLPLVINLCSVYYTCEQINYFISFHFIFHFISFIVLCPTELFGSSRPSSTCPLVREMKRNMYRCMYSSCCAAMLS
jgi:hypothetical protein